MTKFKCPNCGKTASVRLRNFRLMHACEVSIKPDGKVLCEADLPLINETWQEFGCSACGAELQDPDGIFVTDDKDLQEFVNEHPPE